MNDNSNNVIQFPGRKKDADVPDTTPSAATQAPGPASKPKKVKRTKASRKTLAGTVLAVILATGAVNRYVYSTSEESLDFTSTSSMQRSLASVEKFSWSRDSAWEKKMAEKLASPQVRSIASTQIGRSATMEERLLWGTLEEKYTVGYKAEDHRIESLLLQDQSSNPAYVLDRQKFLKEFGLLFESNFSSAKLKSVESSTDKTVEAYTLFDKQERVTGEARFELDRHKRLLSLKVEPSQI